MFKKIIIFSLLVTIFLVVVSFFTRDIDIAKNQLTDKITGTSQNPGDNSENLVNSTQKPTNTGPEPTLTEQQVETELNSGAPIDVDLDTEFSNLETELNQL